MDKEKLNNTANDYLETGNKDLLDDLYRSICRSWRISTQRPDDCSLFNEVFCKAVASFKGGDFVSLLSFCYKNAKRDRHRYMRVRKYREIPIQPMTDDDGSNQSDPNYLVSSFNLEEEVITKIFKKKEADKLILIDYLLESAKIQYDSTMTAIIEEFPRHKTINALGKALGLSRNTVDRKLKSLARHYDGNRFGDIQDYLAV